MHARASAVRVVHRPALSGKRHQPARDASGGWEARSIPEHTGCACGGICPRCAGHGSGSGEGEETVEAEAPAPGPVTGGTGTEATPMAPPPAVASITPNIGTRGSNLAHVPPCGAQPTIRFTAGPATATPVTWSLVAGTAAVASGTALTPDATTRHADMALGAAQVGGTVTVGAVTDAGGVSIDFTLASHPTGITSTRVVGALTNAAQYGGQFDHVFTSNDGIVASLNQVAVGEKFPNLPDPDAASHTFATVFGDFTLHTGTLPDAASAGSGNWFLTAAGELGGTHDNVGIAKSMIDIGRHLVSDSNPTPTNPLPAGFTVDQQFFWWCPHAAAGSRWTQFAATTHRRELNIDSSTDTAKFVTTVNRQPREMDYDGTTGVTNARADPATTPPSVTGGTANTVQIAADAYPSGRALHFSIQGAALGCTINARTGVLTIGTQTGTVRVRVANTRGGPNWDEINVTIATPPPPATAPSNPAPTGVETPAVAPETAPPVS